MTRASIAATSASDNDILIEEISEISGIAGWEVSLPSMHLRWTRQVCRILEIDEATPLTAEMLASYFGIEGGRTIQARVRDVVELGQESEAELEIVTGQGRRRLVRVVRRVVFDGGQPVRILATAQDITDLRAANVRVKEANERLAAAIDVSGLRLWEIDFKANTFRFDPYLMKGDGGRSREPFPRQQMYDMMHAEDRERVLAEFDQVVWTGAPLKTRWRVNKGGGVTRLLEQRVLREVDSEGRYRLFGIGRDITEEVEQQRELVARRVEAEAASAAKSDFLARMSHEIRTPLNGVIGMLEVLKRSAVEAEQRAHTETALKSARDLMHVLDDVIDVSQLEARKLVFNEGPFDPLGLATSVSDLFGARAAEKNIALVSEAIGPLPAWLLGDERRLRQILTNLVGNALKFTEQGSVRIETRFDQAASVLHFVVSDTGIGLLPETLHKLFLPFFQADTSSTRSRGGSGLGLSICRQLVEAMGGSIGVESEFGVGSRFSVSVPAVIVKEPTVELEPATTLPPLRILIAEDNVATQRILKALLAPDGHHLTIAENGQIAVAQAASGDFDVVIMDVMMPVMDGATATRKIRELGGRISSVPIIALTANALVGDRDRYIAAGMTDYLAKPIDVEMLFGALARAAAMTAAR